ncbi:35412_t:CDS:2, partial [Racocetra persica]
ETQSVLKEEKDSNNASREKLYDEQSENKDQLEKVNEEQSENKDQLEEVNEDEEDFGRLSEDEIEACNLLKKIPAALKNLALDIKKKNINSEVWVCLNSIRFYLQLVKNNHQKIETSKIIADAAGKGCIMLGAFVLGRMNMLCFLWDKDILLQIKSYIQENKWNITPYMIMSQMNKVLLPGLGFAPPPTISLNTAKNYLKELGYVYERVKKSVYIDGHEREDVVAYREIFLQRISELEYRMPIFSGDKIELSREACVITYPGKNGDGWWKSEDLINQIINCAIPIFEACFLGYQALFAFDNATSHAIFSPDALITNYMNLGLAGKQEKLRSTSYFREGIRYDQDMIFSSDYRISELHEEAKGLREVLRKRGLWPEKGLKLKETQELMS